MSACTSLTPSPEPVQDQKAREIAQHAQSFNHAVTASKGMAKARLETRSGVQSFKIAWAAVFPDKARVTFMMSGYPYETIISDGRTTTFISHTGEHAPHTSPSGNPNFKNYIDIPVKLSELLSVLLGRYPLRPYDRAFYIPNESDLPTIALKNGWKSIGQYLDLDADQRIGRMRNTDYQGGITHSLTFREYKKIGDTLIPHQIFFQDHEDRILSFRITFFQVNPEIKSTVFQTKSSKK